MLNKISQNKIYNYPISFRANSCNDSNKITYSQIDSQEYMSSDISSASKAYGMALVNQNIIPQTSLKNLVNYLEKQGMVEGKDYEVDSSFTCGNTVLSIKNKQGQEKFAIHYDGGNFDNWNCYDQIEYNGDKPSKMIFRNANNEIEIMSKKYSKSERYHLFDEFYKSPQDYIKYLDEQGIRYEVVEDNDSIGYTELDENGNEISSNTQPTIYINEFDENGNNTATMRYYYFEGSNYPNEYTTFSRHEYKNDKEIRRLAFNSDSVDVITYVMPM